MVFGSPHDLGQHQVLFLKHDEAINWRSSAFTRVGWVMLLDFLIDFLQFHYIAQAVSPFGKLLQWQQNDRMEGRVLVKVLAQDLDSIPRRLVLKKGNEAGGQGFSWIVYVYILNSDFPDAMPEDEELPLHFGVNANLLIQPVFHVAQPPLEILLAG